MATGDAFSFSPSDFSGVARLFPLPNLVLFPHVMQPLHVFEPRYRDLFEAALIDDRLIAMATLAPGWEPIYEGRPAVQPIACLGRIVVHHRLDNGSYNVLLSGLERVRIVRELPPLRSFREAEVRLLDDVNLQPDADAARRIHDELRSAFLQRMPHLVKAHEQLEPLLANEESLGALTDIIGYMLDVPQDCKLALLAEPDVHARARKLLECLSAALVETSPGSAGTIAFPPPLSVN
jgi:Lon protease-like protein